MKGKKPKIFYYIENILKYFYPRFLCRIRTKQILTNARQRADFDYILDRVNYYCKLENNFSLDSFLENTGGDISVSAKNENNQNNKIAIKDFKYSRIKKPSEHFFDTNEHIRFFPENNKFSFIFGDVTHIPTTPSIVKSRPITNDNSNRNSVLLNLGKRRHFVFIEDKIPFRKKENKIIFYAAMKGMPRRVEFMKKYFGHPEILCGNIAAHSSMPQEWLAKKISIAEHLRYKFILSLEGNDVATNLKWIMSSNSLAVMPRPKYETWFMEGRLVPDFHYVAIKDDFSDLIERMNYFIENPAKAEQIIKNANDYISQFQNKKREKIISLMVLQKYFDSRA